MNRTLPIYKLVIDPNDDSGLDFVALVDEPAIEKAWMAFSDEQLTFKVQSEEKRVISGPLMIANLPIYRKSEDKGEHYVLFDADTIRLIVLKFFRNRLTASVNLMHHDDLIAPGVFMFESFLIDRSRGISPPTGFESLPDGSWFGSYKVDNDEIWDTFIKTGEFTGFSVQGIFQYGDRYDQQQEKINKVREIIQGVLS